jgi:hypothetical protein
MRFTWDPDLFVWAADLSGSGPAGAAVTHAGTIRLEFDRIDCGRLVGLRVPVDDDDEHGIARRMFGQAWATLRHPGATDWQIIDVDLADTPLWMLGRELARSAQLLEDIARLEQENQAQAAAIAAAERAHVLHALDDLAPDPAETELARMVGQLHRRPRLGDVGSELVKRLARQLSQWAPTRFESALAQLGEPVVIVAGRSTPARPVVYAREARVATLAVEDVLDSGAIAWRNDIQGEFAFGGGRGTVHWVPSHHQATLTVTSTDPLPPQWVAIWAGEVLVAEGPLVIDGRVGTFVTGPCLDRPTTVAVLGHLFRDADQSPLSQLDSAIRLGRRAVDLELLGDDSAFETWHKCATAWLGVDEVGRAAIALDRAAEFAGERTLEARADRQRAKALATPWARQFLDGRSGTPYHALWRRAVVDAVPAFPPNRAEPAAMTPSSKPGPQAPSASLPYEEERPVGLTEGGQLFEATEGLRRGLDRVGDHIVAALDAPGSQSMTFLLSGVWGVGKSSALGYIVEYVNRKAQSDDVIFVWYNAPQYAARPDRARATLLYEVVMALQHHAFARSAIDLLINTLAADLDLTFPGLDERSATAARRMRVQRALAQALDDSVDVGPMLEQWLRGFLTDNVAGRRLTTVVLVDDLDRCSSTEFVKELLVATQHWSKVANHFFLIGADEQRVRSALDEHLPDAHHSPDSGLAKYVHVTIKLPAEIPSRTHAARLFGSYLDKVKVHDATRQAISRHLDRPVEADLGVLDPLLLGCSPRTLKERFNSLVSVLDRRLDSDHDADEFELSDWTVKRAVLQVRWPDAFAKRIQPAELGDPSQIARFEHLLALGRHALRANPRDVPAQEVSVKNMAETSHLGLSEADALLALYLASEPAWSTVGPESGIARDPSQRGQPSARRHGRAQRPEQFEPHNPPRLQDLNEMLNTVETAWTSQLDEKLAQLRSAAELRDTDSMRALFDEVAPLVDAVSEPPRQVAETLGGIAAAYASADLRSEALFLHLSAYRANPQRPDVAHNLVDFVLDHDTASMYPMVEAVLHTFDNTFTGASLRQRMLQLRIDQRLGRVTDNERFGQLVYEATVEGSGIGRAELIELLEVARDLGRFDDLQKIASVLLDREAGDLSEQARTVRTVADTMGASPDSAREEYAAALYRNLMTSGLIQHLPPQQRNHLLRNLAALLTARRQLRPAAYVLWCALRIEDSQELRTLLARALNRLGNGEAAEDLLSAQQPATAVRAPTSPPFDQPLFPPSPSAQAWFERHFPDAPYGDPMAPEVWQ